MEAHQNKEPSLYRDVLRQAWSVVARLRFLWIFGFFAALAASGEQYSVLRQNVSAVVNLPNILPAIGAAGTVFAKFVSFFKQLVIAGSFIDTSRFDAVLLFVAIFLAPIVLGQIAIIATTNRYLIDKKKTGFTIALGEGGKNFVLILILDILLKVLVYGLLAVVAYPSFARLIATSGSHAALNALAVTVFLVLVPIQIILSFLMKFASAYVVIQGKNLGQAVAAAWRLFVEHWLIALEMAFLLIVIDIVSSRVLFGIIQNFITPVGPYSTGILLVIVLWLGALLAAFQYAAWTVLFFRLEARTAVSKIARWADIVSGYFSASKPTTAK